MNDIEFSKYTSTKWKHISLFRTAIVSMNMHCKAHLFFFFKVDIQKEKNAVTLYFIIDVFLKVYTWINSLWMYWRYLLFKLSPDNFEIQFIITIFQCILCKHCSISPSLWHQSITWNMSAKTVSTTIT